MLAPEPIRRRIGVIGTLVWDVIHGVPPKRARVEGWGGLAYALSGLDAALGDDWEIVPLVKVGHDVAAQARTFVAGLRHVAPDAALVEVPEPNNRSELRYHDDEHRSECMSGGVPGWTWEELAPRLDAARLDALYVNFLGGWEIDLHVAERIRARFRGPIYGDLHMLLWAVQPSGLRHLRPLDHAREWCRCFDYIQVNEAEMAMLAPSLDALAALAHDAGVRCTMVTLGPRGAVYHAAADADSAPHGVVVPPATVRRGADVDPTGCGDVWGATAFARLLAGAALPDALRAANVAAGRNAGHHGVTGLVAHLAADADEGPAPSE